jgi:NitT/TauT family transport system permease protein
MGRALPRLRDPLLLAALILVVAWEVTGRAIEYRFLPPLSSVLGRSMELLFAGSLGSALLVSLGNLAIGLLLAIAIGMAVGTAMGLSRRLYAGLEVYVHAMLTAPSIVFAPVFFSMFGLGREPVIAVITMFAVFKIIINTADGLRNTPPELIEMGRSFGSSRADLFRRVRLPSALPLILTGVRVGAGAAVQGMVVAEMFIAVIGLGEIVMRAGRRFDAETVLAVIVFLVVIALALMTLIRVIDERLTQWLPDVART